MKRSAVSVCRNETVVSAHPPHLIIACGGTGGHFYPTLAVAQAFCALYRQRQEKNGGVAAGGARVTFLVSGSHAAEQQAIAREAGFAAIPVEAVKLPHSVTEALPFLWRLPHSLWVSRRVLASLKGDVMLSMGSYAAVPPTLAWPWRRRPLVLHEGNTVMGKANRLAALFARKVALSLPLRDKGRSVSAKSCLTGMPLREAVVRGGESPLTASGRSVLLERFGLHTGRRTVLLFGGSQGAQALNRMLAAVLPLLPETLREQLQFIALTGTDDNASLRQCMEEYAVPAHICRSDPQIEECYRVADLIVCRGGASSLCEIALYGRPLIIVPLPGAADNHQYWNARAFEEAGAARILPQAAGASAFAALLRNWLDEPEKWSDMGARAIAHFARPAAAQAVAGVLLETLYGADVQD